MSRAVEAVLRGVTITHPDKPLWPDAGDARPVTKRDLAAYFDVMADHILPHIAGRPCSIVRAPEGIAGQRFFQRHVTESGAAQFTRVKVKGDPKPYLQIDTAEALIAAAQIGALELHPWNCRPGALNVPGRLVFDLDPAPDVSFAEVIAAAKDIKARLEAVGLAAFLRTTGGKGLHVVTPLAPEKRLAWTNAKAFARALCAAAAKDAPERYVMTMSKAARGGKVFLDYLRNDRMATAVAPYSPRARAGAPVSMPISWAQARAGLDPAKFTIRSAPGRLAKADPWQDYCDAERPLSEAIRRLGRVGTRA